MTLAQLHYALTLQESGSFKRASEHLNISQPALSMQMQKLEEELTITLFNRQQQPIVCTEDGRLFLERARQIVQAANSLVNFSQSLHQHIKGELQVGVIPTLAPFLVPLFAEDLQRAHPGLHLDITESVTQEVIARVLSGQYDAGLISTPFSLHGLEVTPLFYEKFFVYTADPHFSQTAGVDLSTLDYENLWLLEEGNCFRDQLNDFCDLNKIRRHKPFIYRSNSIDALIRLVDQKGGTTILPELSTLSLNAEQEDRLKPINGIPKAREIGLISVKHPAKPYLIEKLREAILNSVPKSLLSAETLEVVDPAIRYKR